MDQFSDKEFEQYLENGSHPLPCIVSVLTLREKVRSHIEMLKTCLDGLASIPETENTVRLLLRENIAEVLKMYSNSMTQFDFLVLEQLGSDDDDDDEDDDILSGDTDEE